MFWKSANKRKCRIADAVVSAMYTALYIYEYMYICGCM
jgi:hypothetical protein